jgi:hypothetical protein
MDLNMTTSFSYPTFPPPCIIGVAAVFFTHGLLDVMEVEECSQFNLSIVYALDELLCVSCTVKNY